MIRYGCWLVNCVKIDSIYVGNLSFLVVRYYFVMGFVVVVVILFKSVEFNVQFEFVGCCFYDFKVFGYDFFVNVIFCDYCYVIGLIYGVIVFVVFCFE